MRKVLRLIRRGVPRTAAVTAGGIGWSTYMRWMQQARAADRKLEEGVSLTETERLAQQFRDLADRQVAFFEGETIHMARQAAIIRGRPDVLLDILSRHPETRERWKPASAVEVTGRGGGPVLLERVEEMTDAELSARFERLERIARERHDKPPE